MMWVKERTIEGRVLDARGHDEFVFHLGAWLGHMGIGLNNAMLAGKGASVMFKAETRG